jgi:hypothetical protein
MPELRFAEVCLLSLKGLSCEGQLRVGDGRWPRVARSVRDQDRREGRGRDHWRKMKHLEASDSVSTESFGHGA